MVRIGGARDFHEYRRGEIVVVDNDIGKAHRVNASKIELLAGNVALRIPLPYGFRVAKEVRIARLGARHGVFEASIDKDTEVPKPSQFFPMKKDTVENEDGILGRNFRWRGDGRVGQEVEAGAAKTSRAVWSKRSKQRLNEHRVVERIGEIAVGG